MISLYFLYFFVKKAISFEKRNKTAPKSHDSLAAGRDFIVTFLFLNAFKKAWQNIGRALRALGYYFLKK